MAPLRVDVPLDRLTLIPEGDRLVGRVSTFCISANTEGARSSLRRSTQTFAIPVTRQEAIETVSIRIDVPATGGTGRISVGVLDESSGNSGYATISVEDGG